MAIHLPPEIEARIKRFEEHGLTGQIRLDYQGGKIGAFEVRERRKVQAPQRIDDPACERVVT